MADSRLNPLYLGKEEIMIAIGCDQGGFALKQEIMAYLDKKGYKYKDFGSYSEASVDYPEYARKVCAAINDGTCDTGLAVKITETFLTTEFSNEERHIRRINMLEN